MSSKEIVKLLRRCMFSDTLLKMAADKIEELESEITKQQTEIEGLKEKCENIQMGYNFAQDDIKRLKKDKYKLQKALNQSEDYRVMAKSEAVKEFAERLKENISDDCHIVSDEGEYVGYDCDDVIDCIDNLVKEMVGEENDR